MLAQNIGIDSLLDHERIIKLCIEDDLVEEEAMVKAKKAAETVKNSYPAMDESFGHLLSGRTILANLHKQKASKDLYAMLLQNGGIVTSDELIQFFRKNYPEMDLNECKQMIKQIAHFCKKDSTGFWQIKR